MTKEEIVKILEEKHQELFDLLLKKSDDYWMKAPKDKWTVGQHVLHLVNSLKLLNKALKYPKFILKYKFGVCNRENRSYETVAKKYDDKLIANKEKAKAFNQDLKTPIISDREELLAMLQMENKKLQAKTNTWKDKHLDSILIPHPLMGRMTVREIIMWTAYHTQHHTTILKENYS